MQSTKPTSAYPQATKDGVAIPHDIALPTGLLFITLPSTTPVSTSQLPANALFISVYATEDCILDFRHTPAPIVQNEYTQGVFHVSKGVVYTIAIDGMGNNVGYNSLTLTALTASCKVTIHTHTAWGLLGENVQRGTI